MKLIDLSSQEERIATFHKIVALISLIVFLGVGFYGLYGFFFQDIEVVGLNLVAAQIPIKPVTMFFLASIAGFYSILQVSKNILRKFSKFHIDFTKFIAFLIASVAFYEIFFNFTFWGGNIAAQATLGQINPDFVIIEPLTKPQVPWSVLFATKVWIVLFVNSLYYLYFIMRFEKKKETLN